jgi:L-threonylcarbamoyladenylate synthase
METKLWKLKANEPLQPQLKEAASLLAQGQVVAFPTETVYGLGADGLNPDACRKIFAAKGRPADNPLILHICEMDQILQLTSGLTPIAKKLMEAFWPGPMTLIVHKSDIIPDVVTAGLDTVAVRFPVHEVARELIRLAGTPIAAPSANKSGKPSPTNAQDVLQDMDGIIAGIVDGGACNIGVESTIIDTTGDEAVILRPGGITREMIAEVMGKVEIDPGLVKANETPKAPGMKYRHYAPKAPMVLIEGPEASQGVIRAAIMAEASGLKVGVIAMDETVKHLPKSEHLVVHNGGKNQAELAENLFRELRMFDRENVDTIIGEGVGDENLGLAIMNRMRKSAGHNIIWAEGGLLRRKSGQVPEYLRNFVIQ